MLKGLILECRVLDNFKVFSTFKGFYTKYEPNKHKQLTVGPTTSLAEGYSLSQESDYTNQKSATSCM